MTILIGLSGKCGVGKNFIAETILPTLFKPSSSYILHFMAFADQLKVEVGARFPYLTYKELFEEKTPNVRYMLQKYGTEKGRQFYHPDMWIRAAELWMETKINRYKESDRRSIFIFTDVRFPNEADWILKRKGCLIRILAEDRHTSRVSSEQVDTTHPSETALDHYPFTNIIVNTQDQSIQELKYQINHILDPWKRIANEEEEVV